ncbi:tRNA-queuosine alpha-mannosyltransferase domain-containing protein [Marinobacter fuscus]|nr:DUF3524 domain-containing protein [Marinobacter fuscus]
MTEPGRQARVLMLSAYDAGSHRHWRSQLQQVLGSHCQVEVLALPPRFFQWRIRGNAISWLREPLLREHWDLLIATSMVDLATLKGLQPALARVPSLLYMHENQFAFPANERNTARLEPMMVNLYSALAADAVVFNSAWNRDSFLQGVEVLLGKMPDAVPEGVVDELRKRCEVVPVPIDDRLFAATPRAFNRACPHLVWNHRWEYDKAPDRLLGLLQVLRNRQQPFRLSVVGERFRRAPRVFEQIRHEFRDQLECWGYLPSRTDYQQLLGRADIVVSTALHDFQGLAMLEAMAAGCTPLAPDRLAYREYVPAPCRHASHEADPAPEAEAAADCLQRLLAADLPACLPDAWRTSNLSQHYWQVIDRLLGAQ